MSISLKFNYIPYKIKKMTFFYLFTKNMIVNKQKVLVCNMLFDPNNSINTLLQIELIFNIGSTIYIISFRLNNYILIFFSTKLLMKYHDKISITLLSSKNDRFDHSSNVCFSLISYITIPYTLFTK